MSWSVEYGSKDGADKAREVYEEWVCPEDDDRRLKTVHFRSDTPDNLREQIEVSAESETLLDDITGKMPELTDAERERIKELGGFKGRATTFNWRSAKYVFDREGLGDQFWDAMGNLTDYDDPKEGANSYVRRYKRGGHGGGSRDVGEEDQIQKQKQVNANQRQQEEGCDHARQHCEHGDPEACEFLKNACGYDAEEVDQILGPDDRADQGDDTRQSDLVEIEYEGETLQVTPKQAGAIRSAWKSYKTGVGSLETLLSDVRKEVINSRQAFRTINRIRSEEGQDELHPDKLHDHLEALDSMPGDIPEVRTLEHYYESEGTEEIEEDDVGKHAESWPDSIGPARLSSGQMKTRATYEGPDGVEFGVWRQQGGDRNGWGVKRHDPDKRGDGYMDWSPSSRVDAVETLAEEVGEFYGEDVTLSQKDRLLSAIGGHYIEDWDGVEDVNLSSRRAGVTVGVDSINVIRASLSFDPSADRWRVTHTENDGSEQSKWFESLNEAVDQFRYSIQSVFNERPPFPDEEGTEATGGVPDASLNSAAREIMNADGEAEERAALLRALEQFSEDYDDAAVAEAADDLRFLAFGANSNVNVRKAVDKVLSDSADLPEWSVSEIEDRALSTDGMHSSTEDAAEAILREYDGWQQFADAIDGHLSATGSVDGFGSTMQRVDGLKKGLVSSAMTPTHARRVLLIAGMNDAVDGHERAGRLPSDSSGEQTDPGSFAAERQGTLGVGVDAEETAEDKQVTLTGEDEGSSIGALPSAWRVDQRDGGEPIRYSGGPYKVGVERSSPGTFYVRVWGPNNSETVAENIDGLTNAIDVAARFTDQLPPNEVSFHSGDRSLMQAAAEAKKAIQPSDGGLASFSNEVTEFTQ